MAKQPDPRLPLPTARVVKINKLTESEKRELQALGLEDMKELPSDLSQLVATARKTSTDVTQIPAPEAVHEIAPDFKLPLPPVREASPEELREVQKTFASLVSQDLAASVRERLTQLKVEEELQAQRAALPETVAQAVNSAEEVTLDDDEETTGEPKTSKPGSKVCLRCGLAHGEEPWIKPTPQDIYHYLQALFTPFVKTFDLYDGRIVLVVRSLRTLEQDFIQAQLFADQSDNKIASNGDFLENLGRYRTTLQLYSLSDRSADKFWQFPDNLSGWAQRLNKKESELTAADIWRSLSGSVLQSESLYRLVSQTVLRFNHLVNELEQGALKPNFSKATGESSS